MNLNSHLLRLATLLERQSTTGNPLERRLHKAGCMSTRVRVLAHRYPKQMGKLVSRIEKLSQQAKGTAVLEDAFDTICESWYLSDVKDDAKALKQLAADVKKLRQRFRARVKNAWMFSGPFFKDIPGPEGKRWKIKAFALPEEKRKRGPHQPKWQWQILNHRGIVVGSGYSSYDHAQPRKAFNAAMGKCRSIVKHYFD